MLPMGSSSRRLLIQSAHSSIANATASNDRLERPPRPARMDDLGLIETVDGLSEHIVVAVANASNRRPDTRLRQAFGIIAT